MTEQFEVRATAYDNSIWRRYIGLFTGRTDLLVVVRLNRDAVRLARDGAARMTLCAL